MRRCVAGGAIGALVLVGLQGTAQATDYSWVGPQNCGPPSPCGGDANDGMNWDPPGGPSDPDDTASISGGTSMQAIGIDNLGGTLRKLTVSGNVVLNTGDITIAPTMNGPGTLAFSGGGLFGTTVHVTTGSVASITGPFEMDGGSVLDNAGAVAWLSGMILGDQEAAIKNSGTFTASAGTSLGYGFGTDDADIFNTGTFIFTGPGTLDDSQGYWGFHNSGVLQITSGKIDLYEAGNTFNSFDDGGSITGAGTLRFIEPTTDVDLQINGKTTIDAGATVELATGSYVEGGGTIDGPGTLVWSGGHIVGGTQAAPIVWGPNLVVQMSGPETKDLASATLDNQATSCTWSAGDLGGSGDTLFINDGTFTMSGDLAIDYSPSGGANTATFRNNGTFVKSAGNGVGTIQSWGFTNAGTINVKNGAFELESADNSQHELLDGSTTMGLVRAREDASNAYVVLTGSINVASGSLELAENSTFTGNGVVKGPGTTILDGGLIEVDGTNSITFDKSGAVNITSGVAQTSFSLDDGAFLTFAGTTTWKSGAPELLTGTLTNTGNFTVTVGSELQVNTSGTTFDNQGTFTFDPGQGQPVLLDLFFMNSGTVISKSGVGVFSGYDSPSFQQSGGKLSLAGGDVGSYTLSGDPMNPHNYTTIDIEGGRLEGSGNIDGDVENKGTLAPGGSKAAGKLTITQTYTQDAAGTYEVELGGKQPGMFDTIDVNGDVTIDGAISVALLSGYKPSVGDKYLVVTSEGADNIDGMFATLKQPSGATVTATYDPMDVVLGVDMVTEGNGGGGAGGASSSSSTASGAGASSTGGGSASAGGASTSSGKSAASATNAASSGSAGDNGDNGTNGSGCSCRVDTGSDDGAAFAAIGALAILGASRRRRRGTVD